VVGKEEERLVREAKRQGWTAKPTKSGTMLLASDGVGKVLLHHTPSDRRSLANALAKMRRHGFVWPPPKVKGRGT